MILGTQLFIGGFVSELVRVTNPDRNKYVVEDVVGSSE